MRVRLRRLRSRRCLVASALGRIRTCDTWFRKPVLYPLSYEGSAPTIYRADLPTHV